MRMYYISLQRPTICYVFNVVVIVMGMIVLTSYMCVYVRHAYDKLAAVNHIG